MACTSTVIETVKLQVKSRKKEFVSKFENSLAVHSKLGIIPKLVNSPQKWTTWGWAAKYTPCCQKIAPPVLLTAHLSRF